MCWLTSIQMPIRIPTEAVCRKAAAHDWRSTAYRDATVETCAFCSAKAVYRNDAKGRMDNKKYLRAHFRSFVQPRGPTAQAFAAIWGEGAWRKAVRERPNVADVDWDLAAEDAKKYLRELRKEKNVV